MANEIKISVRRNTLNGTFKNDFNPSTQQVDQAGLGEEGAIFNIATTATGQQIVFSEIGTEGWLSMQNHDTANFVSFGPHTGTGILVMGRMEAGEPALFRMEPSSSLTLRADTATCDVEISLLED